MAVLNELKKGAESEAFMEFYLMGLADGMIETLDVIGSKAICKPNGSNNTQHQLVIRKYLENNPAKLHEPIYFIAFLAFQEAYPCAQ